LSVRQPQRIANDSVNVSMGDAGNLHPAESG
jgi:hypothetical protein